MLTVKEYTPISSSDGVMHRDAGVADGLALKEWAVAIRALDAGDQILLLRKGGIVEETKDFRVRGASFFLYPTYEHQKKELVKPEWHRQLEATLRGREMPPKEVEITHAARVVEDIELQDEAALANLADLHIWTENYASQRLHWRPYKPLHVLAVRVYRLDEPRILPVRETYLGCTSWIRLEDQVSSRGVPVLGDQEFRERLEAVHRRVGWAGTP
ncbi:DUF1802 family protein [Kyrpidia tusciae]|uniref:DUF1802 domain-containing protein n=1 Tax=Kyrpidia tusciae (strain DSM 2912 / NBRC 15312 / T2) TaxID=562970 RepID=D5WTS3_KYRT2|nr:DUF1802 family protein [Kyrpidia tusciae]ADG05243.1 Protein of unknown function DUF1802 [Kyrpidia tusciae DSM 2912]